MSTLNLVYVIIGLISPLVVSKHVQFYRKDYTYVEKYDAFYKVHWDLNGLAWNTAFNACYEEGARLFYPSGDEWTIIKNLTEAMSTPPNSSDIYVGLHDEFNLGQFITIDGKPTESPLNEEDDGIRSSRCMLMDYLTGQFRVADCNVEIESQQIIPFVCKKVDESCPTIDHEYKYVKGTKKCYKVNKIAKTWQGAMQTCFMEGGVLAVVESNSDVPDWTIENRYYFIGFRRMFSSLDFYTVKGNTHESALFNKQYRDNYPNQDCGVMKKYNNNNIEIQTQECAALLPFICEMLAK